MAGLVVVQVNGLRVDFQVMQVLETQHIAKMTFRDERCESKSKFSETIDCVSGTCFS